MYGGDAVMEHSWLAYMEIAWAKRTTWVNKSDSASSPWPTGHTTVRSDELSMGLTFRLHSQVPVTWRTSSSKASLLPACCFRSLGQDHLCLQLSFRVHMSRAHASCFPTLYSSG